MDFSPMCAYFTIFSQIRSTRMTRTRPQQRERSLITRIYYVRHFAYKMRVVFVYRGLTDNMWFPTVDLFQGSKILLKRSVSGGIVWRQIIFIIIFSDSGKNFPRERVKLLTRIIIEPSKNDYDEYREIQSAIFDNTIYFIIGHNLLFVTKYNMSPFVVHRATSAAAPDPQ